jgi:hypothetical protein
MDVGEYLKYVVVLAYGLVVDVNGMDASIPVIQLQPNSTTPSGTNTIRASHELCSEHQGLSCAIRITINTTVLPSEYYGSHHLINTATYAASLRLD